MVEILVTPPAPATASAVPAAPSAYKARDVVNAPAIKQRIRERSEQRGDAPEVTAWLLNHFCRHVIGNVACTPQTDPSTPAGPVQRLADSNALQERLGRKEAPAWALERLRKKAEGVDLPDLWWVEPDSPAVLALETRLVEFLSTRKGTSLEGKLQRVNCPQALARWTLEHLAFEKKQSNGWVEHSKDAVHGKMRLFSYRTGSAQPRITINAVLQKDGSLQIEQIKGKQNRPPIARYVPDVAALLNHLPLNDEVPADALAMGLVRRPAEVLAANPALAPWCAVAALSTETEQLWLLRQHPQLLAQLDLRSPLMQWMVAARKDSIDQEIVERMPQSPALRQTLQLARMRVSRASQTGGRT